MGTHLAHTPGVPSFLHEILVELFRRRPELGSELLRQGAGIPLQGGKAELGSIDLSQVAPAEYRSDALTVLRDLAGKAVAAVIAEVQLWRDEDKRKAWPLYVAAPRRRARSAAGAARRRAGQGAGRGRGPRDPRPPLLAVPRMAPAPDGSAGAVWDNSPVAGTKRRMGRPVEKRSKLGVWVDERGWTRQQLADKLGIMRGSAVRLCSGVRRPSLELAIKIEALTEGAVPVGYWVTIPAHSKD